MQRIDITPTWAGLLPALLAVHESATTPEALRLADDELHRMARLADAVGPLVEALERIAADDNVSARAVAFLALHNFRRGEA
jgi:hypothetical protein